MKITLGGVTRVLDTADATLRQSVAIQDYTGLAVAAWQQRLTGIDVVDFAGNKEAIEGALADPAGTAKRSLMFSDPEWIKSVAAAHWLMLAQAGEDPPPLDDDYDCPVLGFYVAFMTAVTEEATAKGAQDQPGPTVSPGRRTPSSRPTASRKKPAARQEDARGLPPGPLPFTGS